VAPTFYVNTCLPFGLRSAPFLFNRLSDVIHWVLQHNYGVAHLLDYLNDFFTAGRANTDDCKNNLAAMLFLCNKINAPVKSSKVEGLSTSLIAQRGVAFPDWKTIILLQKITSRPHFSTKAY